MMEKEYVDLDNCTILAESDMAFRVEYEGDIQWIAKSQIEQHDRLDVGDEDVNISVTEWLCERIGWE